MFWKSTGFGSAKELDQDPDQKVNQSRQIKKIREAKKGTVKDIQQARQRSDCELCMRMVKTAGRNVNKPCMGLPLRPPEHSLPPNCSQLICRFYLCTDWTMPSPHSGYCTIQ
jgi:hypothetical protein